jgi:hypothetical protein
MVFLQLFPFDEKIQSQMPGPGYFGASKYVEFQEIYYIIKNRSIPYESYTSEIYGVF